MAKVMITGAREWSMLDDSGRSFSGLTVYYDNVIEANEGKFGKGTASGKLSLKLGTPLAMKMMKEADYSEPFESEVVYEFVPGKKNAQLVDIIF